MSIPRCVYLNNAFSESFPRTHLSACAMLQRQEHGPEAPRPDLLEQFIWHRRGAFRPTHVHHFQSPKSPFSSTLPRAFSEVGKGTCRPDAHPIHSPVGTHGVHRKFQKSIRDTTFIYPLLVQAVQPFIPKAAIRPDMSHGWTVSGYVPLSMHVSPPLYYCTQAYSTGSDSRCHPAGPGLHASLATC